MKKIPENFFEKIDIIEIVSEKVQLKKVGNQYRGLCPFHNEKNPSFYVSPIGVYHCFGCGESGNAIKFVMKIYGYDYEEALEYIAKKFNIPLEEIEDVNYEFYKILDYLSDYYFENLRKNKDVLNYLYSRGVDDKQILKFRIGFADDKNEILKELIDKGFGLDKLFKIGIAYRDYNGNIKLFFTNRIMFPIFTTNGKNIIGFSGRSVDETEPKYKNSVDSSIFKKSQAIYGFNFAKSSIVKNKFVIIVEGFFDVIILNKFGYENTISLMGTNISDYQAKLIKKYTDRVFLFFDKDKSGQKAIIRNLPVLLNNGLIPYILYPDEDKDPDEIALMGGLDKIIKNPYNISDYFKMIYEKAKSVEEKMEIVNEFRNHLANVKFEGIGYIFLEELKPILDELEKKIKLKFHLKDISNIQFNDEVYAIWNVYKNENLRKILFEIEEDVLYSHSAKELFCAIRNNRLNDESYLELVSKIEFQNKELSYETISKFINKWMERMIIKNIKNSKSLKELENIIKIKRRL
ncbi:MAG: DNA primase [Candidatus Hydrothermia bacterium]|jgi:DNA primase|nr:DNA primase [Candidatus Hydrothermia bacterium]